MTSKLRAVALVAAAALTLVGCSSTNNSSESSSTGATASSGAANSSKESGSVTSASYPVTVTHKQGETVIDQAPERIVALDYAALDYIYSLGYADKVVGVPSGKAKPAIAEQYVGVDEVGSLKEPDTDAIANLEPDLIFLGGRNAETYGEMNKIAPTIDLTNDQTKILEDNVANAKIVGQVFGEEDKVDTELKALDEKMNTVREQVTALNATALIIMTNGGELSAYGDKSRFALIHDLGFTPAAEVKMDGRHGEAISFEYVADANPDYLFVLDRDAAVGEEGNTAEATLDNELIKGTKAAQEGHIIYLDPADWYLVGAGITTTNNMVDAIGEAAAQ